MNVKVLNTTGSVSTVSIIRTGARINVRPGSAACSTPVRFCCLLNPGQDGCPAGCGIRFDAGQAHRPENLLLLLYQTGLHFNFVVFLQPKRE